MSFYGACLALFTTEALAYPSAAERASVQDWDDMAVKYSFDYEIHEAVNEEQWTLTMFRIIGRDGEEPVTSTKPPVLIISDQG